MILWRGYLDDGTTFSNEDGDWTKAPQHGWICVVVRDPTEVWGRWVNSGYAPNKDNEMYARAANDIVNRSIQLLGEEGITLRRKFQSRYLSEMTTIVTDIMPRNAQGNEVFVCYPDSDEPFPTYDQTPFRDKMARDFPNEDINAYIKFGRQVDQLKWQAIMTAAASDADFPIGLSPRRRKTDWQRAAP